MKKLYPCLLLFCLITGCSKDFLKRYEKRIQGTWQLVDVDRRGLGGSIDDLPFADGQFVFSEGGGMVWTNPAGDVYNGSWDIQRRRVSTGCNTDDNGNTHCSDREIKILSITAVDFNTQRVKTEYFDEMEFTGTDHFKTYVHSGLHTYVFRFRRQ